MPIAVLPFNAGPNTSAALARQLTNFAVEIVRQMPGAEVNLVNYLVQVDQDPAGPRYANVNASETLNEYQMLEQLFQQTQTPKVMDGLLVTDGDKHTLDIRFFENGNENAYRSDHYEFASNEAFGPLRQMVEALATEAGGEFPAELKEDENLFGTDVGGALLRYFESYDAVQYINHTQGRVAVEFSPTQAMDGFLEAQKLDDGWESPYLGAVQLTRLCAQYQIGNPDEIEGKLKEFIALEPQDARGYFALGELQQARGGLQQANDSFEKAAQLQPDESAILTRLGLVQMQMGMPVNAERNFRKAVEMEGEDKPTMQFLAQVLTQTGRAHEVPALWKSMVDANPQNAAAHANLAMSQAQAGNEDEAIKTFEAALESLEDKTLIKRVYAPILAQRNEFDRAMDFYEDSLEIAPQDVALLVEYAQTLQAAGRDFEVPKVLKDILATEPEPNVRAQTQAWLTEIEQPKRIESVQNAQAQLEANNPEGALQALKPMRNWLADYWKMWLILAAAQNRAGNHAEAEEAAMQLIQMYPGCEPGYLELAGALGAQNKNEEVYNAMRYALTQVQGSVPIGLNLALAAKRLGRSDEARHLAKQIREAVGNEPQLEQVLQEIEA